MEKIKMTLMEKSLYLRAEMDMDETIIDWSNVEIIDDEPIHPQAQEALDLLKKNK